MSLPSISDRLESLLQQNFAPDEMSDIKAHLPMLYDAARGKRVIEIGVARGTSTLAFLASVEKRGGFLTSIDCNDCSGVANGHPQWRFVMSDSLNPSIMPTGVPAFDVLLIDSDHSRDRTFQELSRWSGCIRPGGVVFLHDSDNPLYPGVREAIGDFLRERPSTSVTWHTGSFGMAEIRLA